MPLGYTNKMLVGNELSSQWKDQLETNDSLKKVLQINQDDAEVDKILNDQDNETVESVEENSTEEKQNTKRTDQTSSRTNRTGEKLVNKLARGKPKDR